MSTHYVSVIGASRCSAKDEAHAEELGALLADRGFVVVCGGRDGIMEAVARGVSRRGGVTIGILPEEEPKVSQVGEHMDEGSLDDLVDRDYNIILGKELAASLGVVVGDKVTLLAPEVMMTPTGSMPQRKSCPPRTTGVPAARPVASAALAWTAPITVPLGCGSARRARSMPDACRSSSE